MTAAVYAHDNVWDHWVGQQSVAEFVSLCEVDLTLEGNVEEYVDDVLAGNVFGPVDFDGDKDDIVALLVAYIETRQ